MENRWTVKKLAKGQGGTFKWGVFKNGEYYEGFRYRPDAERAKLDYAAAEKAFVPYGRCPKHPHVVTSNGMFDAPCNLCEAEQEGLL